MKKNPLGVILYENDKLVAIATGFAGRGSDNVKTGRMIQTWIMVKSHKPTEALKLGLDKIVCGNCPHRGDGTGEGRICYVNLGQGPRAVWQAWKAGRYAPLNADTLEMFRGRKIRLGSYGDPFFVPVAIWRTILSVGENSHTGYTHQWKRAPYLKSICMASVDSFDEACEAWSLGWRTFRVGVDAIPGEVLCPASKEGGHKTTCDSCGLCAGAEKRAKSIYIPPHGTGRKHFITA